MKQLSGILKFITNHPLTKNHKLRALFRFFNWQFRSRLSSGPLLVNWINDTKLVVHRGMTGATGNIYTGLLEFEEMAFLLHFLKEDDYFVDVGANVGVYTVLASGACKAKTLAVEPIPSTFHNLRRNINANDLDALVEMVNCGVSEQSGELFFTNEYDTVNHVVERSGEDTMKVKVCPLDDLMKEEACDLMKVDVEGYEMNVLKGARDTISNKRLKAIIIEMNGSGEKYGIKDKEIHDFLFKEGFRLVSYAPFSRKIERKEHFNAHGNNIYLRDMEWVVSRVNSAEPINVFGQAI